MINSVCDWDEGLGTVAHKRKKRYKVDSKWS